MKNLKRLVLMIFIASMLSIPSLNAQFYPDVIMTSSDGLWTDVRAYTDLNAAITAIGSKVRTLVISKQLTTGTSVIPSNITLKFERDGNINTTTSLNIQTKNIIAPDRPIFSGAGSISFVDGSIVRSSWFSSFYVAAVRTVSSKVTLVISKQETISNTFAIGNNVNLKFESPESRLTVANGFTVSNIGNIEAGDFQILTSAGTGAYVFKDGVNLNCAWFPSFRTAIAFIGAVKATLQIHPTTIIDYTQATPSTLILDFFHFNGSLSVNVGVTLTVNGDILTTSAYPYASIFTGLGAVIFNGSGNDFHLRADLASTASGKGAAMVGSIATGAGALASTVKAELDKTIRTSQYATFAQAIAQATATGRALTLDSTVTIAAPTTISIPVDYEPTGQFTSTNSSTLTLTGPQSGSDGQRFGGNLVVLGLTESKPEYFGGHADNSTDNRLPIHKAFASLSNGGVCNITDTSNTYNISKYVGTDYDFSTGLFKVATIRPNIEILGRPGVKLKYSGASDGYVKDGIRIGVPDTVDAEEGDNAATYTQNIVIRDLEFVGFRAAVRVVRAKNVIVENIIADGLAAVGVGNDGADDCFNITLRNIRQKGWTMGISSAEWYIVGIYRTFGFTVDGVFQDAGMTHTANAAAIQIENSAYGTLTNLHIDQETKFSLGLVVTNSNFISTSNFTIRNANVGLFSYGQLPVITTTTYSHNSFANGFVLDSTIGIATAAVDISWSNITTKGCTTDLSLRVDSALNVFSENRFNPGGTANVYEETANYRRNHKWRMNIGFMEGNSDGYYGGKHPAFYAQQTGTPASVTGDGTVYVIPAFATKSYDFASNFDASTGVFTAPIDGFYQFSASMGIAVNASGLTLTRLFLNCSNAGSKVIGTVVAGIDFTIAGSTTVYLLGGETVSIALGAYGGTKTADIKEAYYNYFQGILLY